MRCNYRLFYLKIKNVLLLLIIFTILILLITLFTHSPYILRNVTYKKIYKYDPPLPGAFLDNFNANNVSYCKFNYNLPENFSYEKSQLSFTPDLGTKSPYRVLYNVIESIKNTSSPVTYSTHVTSGFINYISEIIKLWEGPVSVAAFVPDFDGNTITKQLINLCRCMPEMSKVSIHYVFPISRPPYIKNLLNINYKCSLRESSSSSSYSSSSYSSSSSTYQLQSSSSSSSVSLITYRNLYKLSYPINVCRNVARNAATTHYILTSDVELIPSEYLATSFINLIVRQYSNIGLIHPSHVFVVPVFEVDVFEKVPRNKQQLIKLVKDEKAVYFHRHVCSHCQKFPGLEKWLQNKECDVKPLSTVKREYPYHRWEPIYIGTNDEPFYSELLSWEGKQDKMTQMLEMCLIGYRFIILDGVFLVHWPGIKKKSIENKIADNWRTPYIIKNSRQYSRIISKFSRKYIKKNPKCKMQ